jgi:hypothetical protein
MLVSLALAFFLWLALAGRDTSIFDLTVPLELAGLPADLAIKTEVPASVTIQVMANTAQGRFLADRRLNMQLDVSTAKEGPNAFPFAEDALELPRGVQLNKIVPSMIEFEAVKLIDKMVPVKAATSGRLSAAYRLKAVTVEPDRVRLRGPAEMLGKITEAPTAPIALDGITQSQTMMVSLADGSLPAGLEIIPKELRVVVVLEDVLEKASFPGVPVTVDRASPADGSRVRVAPEKVKISVAWPVSKVRGVAPEDITAQVYVDEEKLRREGKLTLQIIVVPPEGVTVTAIEPPNAAVTYLPPPANGEGSSPSGRTAH